VGALSRGSTVMVPSYPVEIVGDKVKWAPALKCYLIAIKVGIRVSEGNVGWRSAGRLRGVCCPEEGG